MRSSFGGRVIDGRQELVIIDIILQSNIFTYSIAFMSSQDLQHSLLATVCVSKALVEAIDRRICQHISIFFDDALKVADNSSEA